MPDFLTSRFNAVKRRINFFIIASLVFAVGFILGVIFNLKSGVKNPSYSSVEEFVKTVTNPKSNVFGVEIKFFFKLRAHFLPDFRLHFVGIRVTRRICRFTRSRYGFRFFCGRFRAFL